MILTFVVTSGCRLEFFPRKVTEFSKAGRQKICLKLKQFKAIFFLA
jgi:hypothetical protein